MTRTAATAADRLHQVAMYLDLEWTCWNVPPPPGVKQEIIEIGVVSMDLNDLRVLDEAAYFVRPRRWEISAKCTKLTGITDEDIRRARPLSEVVETIAKRFDPKGKPSCAWGDDVTTLAKACNLVGLESPFGRLLICRRFSRARSPGRTSLVSRRLRSFWE